MGFPAIYLGLPEVLTQLDDIEANTNNVEKDIAAADHNWHSRWRVYPQDITASILATAAGVANTFGPWVEVIPLNTIPFPFHVIGFCICQVSANTSYFLQIGYNTVNVDPGVNMEMGERSFRIAAAPISKQSELMKFYSQGIPANSRVMARLKTASGNPDTVNFSVVLSRHLAILDEATLWPAFPW